MLGDGHLDLMLGLIEESLKLPELVRTGDGAIARIGLTAGAWLKTLR